MNERILLDSALRYFLEIVRQGSINKASAQLHVAPSAVSRQIARLEAELGSQLFERHPTGMRLSPSGELLAAHARKARLDAARVVEEITGLEGIQRGTVRLASIEGLASYLLPHVISEYRQKHHGIHFDLAVMSSTEVTQRVCEGLADIGLTISPAPEKNIQVEKRIMAPIHAVMHSSHALAAKKHVSLAQLSHYPLALPTDNTTIRQLFNVSCSRQGLLIEPVMVSNFVTTLVHFAACQGGITLIGDVSVRHLSDAAQLVSLPIRDREMSGRTIEVQTLAGRTLPKGVADFLGDLCMALESDKA
ncbi:DNA-binding transcriptional LysR family regulator [Vreelandella songnenensis]|uniref:DNA-binding transcriptional LysR family regulator n=1 Tax=Vreelandella songnenensis TaxID=1176243 RepID=A0A2T0UXY2_9GAMM|nr:LysR family transcriptional regulator [Halomonas songnenensis]PRY62781.1 DNA-binding transcriptional LysR family regulator [Halomonas songnenensis]